ncbi:uncharacterized protein EI97DRAFT_438942 [Westerdykella ornata]|uniref:Uncharacterized protein n=1 Tax=Westerdykella ornata TaxID=318751 RepID=A0A6A6JYE6_WESOR|nr:uncharacterized protein EI97DRAFT_438942 [Westerdykella ornata]KAF2281622.1 hypothetical protein EI97DRAFT_438942 [Westerdykella ornata]
MLGGIGAGAGLTLSGFAKARLFSPRPGSEEDVLALEALADQMDDLDIVKRMRSYATSYGTQSGWIELDLQDSIANVTTSGEERRVRPLTEQAMAGIQGLGVQRAFWNSETRELVAVVWIGPRLTGWPGIAHGGAIATIFEETMARMIAGPNASIDTIPTPTSISVTYARPTQSFNIYVLRASFSTPDIPQEQPPTEPAPGKAWLPYWKDLTKKWTTTRPGPAVEISGTLESLDGEVKVRAKGVWPADAIKGA